MFIPFTDLEVPLNTRTKWWRVLALLMSFALVATACGGDDDDAASTDDTSAPVDDTDDTEDTEDTSEPAQAGESVDGTLKFASILPMTGDLADFGPGMQAAVELAVEDINAAGGVLGNDVELTKADSATDPEIAGQAAEKAINDDVVDAILGAAGSTVTIQGTVPAAINAGRVVCSGSTTSPVMTTLDDKGFFFRTAPSDAFQSQLLADQITADGYTSVAVVYRSDDYGQSFSDLTVEELENADIDVVAEVGYNVDSPDFSADVAKVADASPEAVVVIAFPEEGGDLIKAMIEQGVGPDDAQHYYTDGLASDELAASVDPNNTAGLDAVKGTRPGAAEEPTEFNDRLKSEKDISDVTFAAQFYDCAVMIALAAVVADTDDPATISEELAGVTNDGEKCSTFADCLELVEAGEDIDYDGVTGFDLDETGEPSSGVYEVWTFEDGAIEGTETVTLSAEED